VTPLEILSRQFRPFALPTITPTAETQRFCGVYLLVDGSEITYIGSSANIASRIWQHLRSRSKRARNSKIFDRAFWYPIPELVMEHYEGAFIRALSPRHNERTPQHAGFDNEILDGFGLPQHADEYANAVQWTSQVRHAGPFTAFSRALKVAREARGMSQRGLASALGLSGAAVGHWEVGTVTPTRDNVVRCAAVLGIPATELIDALHGSGALVCS
jgi:DNA-binding XRE family transcriptional regulator